MATHSSILTWRIPWTQEAGRLQSMGSQGVRQNWRDLAHTHTCTHTHTYKNSPDKNTGVGSHSLLQGIFPTQRLNQGLLHCRPILYCLSHQGSPIYVRICIIYILIHTYNIYIHIYIYIWLSRWHSGKESTYQWRRCKRHGFDPWVRKILWSRKWQSTPVILVWKIP